MTAFVPEGSAIVPVPGVINATVPTSSAVVAPSDPGTPEIAQTSSNESAYWESRLSARGSPEPRSPARRASASIQAGSTLNRRFRVCPAAKSCSNPRAPVPPPQAGVAPMLDLDTGHGTLLRRVLGTAREEEASEDGKGEAGRCRAHV